MLGGPRCLKHSGRGQSADWAEQTFLSCHCAGAGGIMHLLYLAAHRLAENFTEGDKPRDILFF